jgi:ABC-2 type transport system permease protein
VIILATSWFFVPLQIAHPVWMIAFLVLTATTFSLLGFIIGIWADGFEKLQIVPLLVVQPLTFLGGTFYSIHVLPPFWQTVTLANPVVYLVSGFRWSFFEVADVSPAISLAMTIVFLGICLAVIGWMFKTGYRLKNLGCERPSRWIHPARARTRGPCSALPIIWRVHEQST